MKKVANVDDAEIAEIRGKVEDTLAKAKSTADDGHCRCAGVPRKPRKRRTHYVRENPWAAIGIAAAIGIVIGFVAGRR